MADAYNIRLSAQTTTGSIHVDGLTQESADKASELLTLNNQLHHAQFSSAGFHNHITHQLITLWALGANPKELQEGYDFNKGYQAPLDVYGKPSPTTLNDPKKFKDCLGNLEHYADFLRFFQEQITEHGVPATVNRYLFQGDELADNIFARLHSGIIHPIIHLGCGVEFDQPCLIAEALATTCVHEDWPKEFLFPTEQHLKKNPDTPQKPVYQIIDDFHNDSEIVRSVLESDQADKIKDGLMKRVDKQLIPHLAQIQVSADSKSIKEKTTEMLCTSVYMTGAAQREEKKEAMDFITMHCATSAVFYPGILSKTWISDNNKARLLEAKIRTDAIMYAGTGSPTLHPDAIVNYTPTRPTDGWDELIRRGNAYEDDGHTVKFLRAIYAFDNLGLEVPNDFPIAKKDFIKIAHILMDMMERAARGGGAEVPEEKAKGVHALVGNDGSAAVVRNMSRWIFNSGLDSSWENFPNQDISSSSAAQGAVVS